MSEKTQTASTDTTAATPEKPKNNGRTTRLAILASSLILAGLSYGDSKLTPEQSATTNTSKTTLEVQSDPNTLREQENEIAKITATQIAAQAITSTNEVKSGKANGVHVTESEVPDSNGEYLLQVTYDAHSDISLAGNYSVSARVRKNGDGYDANTVTGAWLSSEATSDNKDGSTNSQKLLEMSFELVGKAGGDWIIGVGEQNNLDGPFNRSNFYTNDPAGSLDGMTSPLTLEGVTKLSETAMHFMQNIEIGMPVNFPAPIVK